MSLTIGIGLARVLHIIAMWLYKRSGYRTEAWLQVALVIMLAEVEMRKERDRVPPPATT